MKLKNEVISETKKQWFNRKKLTKRDLKIALFVFLLTVLIIGIVESMLGIAIGFAFQKFAEILKPKPQILVTNSIGQHIVGKHGMPGGIDQKAYLAKITEDDYYLIFELKNDHNIIPNTYFVFDVDPNCTKCFYHTLEIKNIGEAVAENIIIDAETFTNKINVYYQDRRMKVPQNFGGYGHGGINIQIDRLEVNDSAQIAFRIDNPKDIAIVRCSVNNKFGCSPVLYYYKVMPWNEGGILFNYTLKYNFPENLPEGFYEINLKEATFTPLPRRVISEQFGVKDFG